MENIKKHGHHEGKKTKKKKKNHEYCALTLSNGEVQETLLG